MDQYVVKTSSGTYNAVKTNQYCDSQASNDNQALGFGPVTYTSKTGISAAQNDNLRFPDRNYVGRFDCWTDYAETDYQNSSPINDIGNNATWTFQSLYINGNLDIGNIKTKSAAMMGSISAVLALTLIV